MQEDKHSSIPILVIEDEPEIRKLLHLTLASQGYKPIEAINSQEGLRYLISERPEAIIMDIGLPDMDGFTLIKRIREWNPIPILVLSARSQEKDKLAAFDLGIDDYITKPFSTSELIARLKVALRHAHQLHAHTPSELFEYQSLKIDFSSRIVTLNNEEVHLTPIEYKLLSVFAKNAGKVITHAQLLKETWGTNTQEHHHYLRIHIQHLRKKLGDDPLHPTYIITEPGIGYRLKH